jgi:hypothetical protein
MNARLITIAVLLYAVPVRADVVFTITPSAQVGVRSNAVFFTGTLRNTNVTGDVFLNDIQFSFTGSATNYLAGNGNIFFANVPGILAAGETYSDIVFAVAINGATPVGDYLGTVTLVGGTNIFAATNLATQPFQVTSADTPFGAWQLLTFGTNATNTAVSGALADPDGDSVVNLLEYALHLDPQVAGATGLPVPASDPACDCLTLTYTKVIAATDLRYTVQTADDPGGPWSTNGVTQTFITADTITLTLKASDAANPFASAAKRFMRLKVNRLP